MNIFKRPIETETLNAWAKWLEDLAKICIVALPIVIYRLRAVKPRPLGRGYKAQTA
ncbi:hypothetical protein GVX76_04460 [[Haemophilus] felis]|nr:hypothetical protein [[Haemophilus] felis]